MWVRLLSRFGPANRLLAKGATIVFLPVAIVVGYLGSTIEEKVTQDKIKRDNAAIVPVWERRDARQNGAQHTTDGVTGVPK
eukprot:m.99544 g.99544  ORF g.99544 m.99544 type:complete len:81 (+) comp13145_c0_seq2:188-430(+)